MKKVLVFAMAMALGVSATAFAANPFSDVPQGHWAYKAVAELAAAGVVTGFPDGTFKGDMTMTRYEMAQIVAKALAKGSINEKDVLVAEFSDELDNLGVRVSKLEKKSDNIKVNGHLRYRYYDQKQIINEGKRNEIYSILRSRIGIEGVISDDWKYMAMLENYKVFGHDKNSSDDDCDFKRAWIEGRIGKTNITLGRFNYIPQGSNILVSRASNVFDDEIDGIKVGFDVGNFDIDLAYGREQFWYSNCKLFVGTIGTKVGTIDTSIGYYNQESADNNLEDVSIFALDLAGDVAEDLTLSGTALKASKRAEGLDDFGYVLGLKYKAIDKNVVGSYSLSANYYDQPSSTYIMPSIADNTAVYEIFELSNSSFGGFWVTEFDGFKGYRVGVDYTVSKNMIASIYYYDLKMRKFEFENKVILSQMNIYF